MRDPFFSKTKLLRTQGYDVGTIFDRGRTTGEIGIEVEVEGNKFPKKGSNGINSEYIPQIWDYHRDGSLRGEDNAEYVLKKPILFSEVPNAVGSLWEMFEKFGSVLSESNRTSVHVHLNVQSFHLNRLCSFVALYYSVEELLTAWCGDHRIGNLFCLRGTDAPAIITRFKEFVLSNGSNRFSDGMHYGGLNVQALQKFGSLEIRSLRGVTDPNTILNWVSILERIYKMSADFPDPRSICESFSGQGHIAYLEMILGDKTGLVLNNIDYTETQIQEAALKGIRIAQDICYCRNWDLYEPIILKRDPFGRKKRIPVNMIEAAPPASLGVMPMASWATISPTTPTSYTAVAHQFNTISTYAQSTDTMTTFPDFHPDYEEEASEVDGDEF